MKTLGCLLFLFSVSAQAQTGYLGNIQSHFDVYKYCVANEASQINQLNWYFERSLPKDNSINSMLDQDLLTTALLEVSTDHTLLIAYGYSMDISILNGSKVTPKTMLGWYHAQNEMARSLVKQIKKINALAESQNEKLQSENQPEIQVQMSGCGKEFNELWNALKSHHLVQY